MLVTVLKESYVIVLSEDAKDERWLNDSGYDALGEDYYQEIFKDFQAFIDEVNYLKDFGAKFEDTADADCPYKVYLDLKEEDFI